MPPEMPAQAVARFQAMNQRALRAWAFGVWNPNDDPTGLTAMHDYLNLTQ
jgi:hypothetical protein